MMKYAFFLGCNIPVRVPQYELSARAVLEKLAVEVVDHNEFKCCGNPIQNIDQNSFILMAARNLAVAEEQQLDMMVLCMCCFGALKKAAHLMAQNPFLREEVNDRLSGEGLRYTGRFGVKHFLSVLYHDLGVDVLTQKIETPFKGLRIASHYGCHGLRPSDVTEFDNPVAPVLLDELVAITGAQSVNWPLKLECCGAPLFGVNDSLSMDITRKKLTDAIRAGADYLCVACPYCQMQFDQVQKMMTSSHDTASCLPSVVFPQLLGLAMGIPGHTLGLYMNALDISNMESFLE